MTRHADFKTARSAAVLAASLLVVAACAGKTAAPKADESSASSAPITNAVRFAVVGDFGGATAAEDDVADLVKSWSPDFVITTGDNNYPDGAASTIDANVGQFYHSFIFPYAGRYGAGAEQNRFFPSLGNHDWVTSGATPYLNYFTLPGNERYYDFVRGPIHFFALDSDPHEPDGTSPTSLQGTWLKSALAAATEPWKIVYFHHSPFSSGTENGPSEWMQWPFQQWGATAVVSGHDHDYERFLINGFPYLVNGVGGEELYEFGPPMPGSVVRYADDYGAMLGQATSTTLQLQFFNREGVLIDTYALPGSPAVPMNDVLANGSAIAVPSIGLASPYASKITVSGQPVNPSKVTVTLAGLSHTYPDDLDVLLVGPRGQSVVLLSDAGGGNAVRNVTLTFDDGAAAKLSDSSLIGSGTFRPTDFATGDAFASPAPGGAHGATLSTFAGLDPNGTWSLYVLDDEDGDSGSLAGGWSIRFTYP